MPGRDTTSEEAAAANRAGYNPGLLLFPAQNAQGACVTSTEGARDEAGAGPTEVSSSQPALASKSQSKQGPTSNNPGGGMAGNRSQNIKHKITLMAIPTSLQTPRRLGRPRNQGQLYAQP
uniref:Uncharacterized protein n=1 Tax=Mandrillus leucophaeus TaxID=9568 RepID=A0A2K5ZQK9_MANLE